MFLIPDATTTFGTLLSFTARNSTRQLVNKSELGVLEDRKHSILQEKH